MLLESYRLHKTISKVHYYFLKSLIKESPDFDHNKDPAKVKTALESAPKDGLKALKEKRIHLIEGYIFNKEFQSKLA